MSEKKTAVPAAPAAEVPASEPKTRKASGTPARRGRPPLTPEVYVEYGGNQYNITDVVERAKADYRTTHKVGVQSCKVYVKPEEGAAYYVINKVSGKLELYFSLRGLLSYSPSPKKTGNKKDCRRKVIPSAAVFFVISRCYRPYSSLNFRVR